MSGVSALLPSRDALRAAALASAALLASCASVALLRAYLAGRPAAPAAAAALPPLFTDPAALAAHFAGAQDAIALRLARALTLRTISFEAADGTPASLLPPRQQEDPAAPPPARAPAGGCMCCREALGGEPAAAAAAPGGGGSAPTPAALQEAREAFLAFHAHLQASFPRMHAALERHVVNSYSLLYLWRPRGAAEQRQQGIALCAHMDVVPVPDAEEWEHAPFAGAIAGGFVHGRGAIDDKHSLMCICEAVEHLLARGWAPSRPVVLCFGHDEELGGSDGAAHFPALIERLLPARCSPAPAPAPAPARPRRPLLWALDEGLFLLSDLLPGLRARAALVCTGEKGHVNVELTAAAPASHSSVPPRASTIGALARALAALEAAPYPPHRAPAMAMFAALLPAMPFGARVLFANEWLLGGAITAALLAAPATAAMLRTTTALTIARAGVKSNVMPPRALAIVNRRIHPADSVAGVLARDAAVVARAARPGDPPVALRALEALEPSPQSSAHPSAPGWLAISRALQAAFGGGGAAAAAAAPQLPVIAAPALMMGNTDTRHFWGCAEDIYRHCPTELTMAETRMFHGKNERVSVGNLARLCAFYVGVIVAGQSREAQL
jgi:carboxypeptidase PM20D1